MGGGQSSVTADIGVSSSLADTARTPIRSSASEEPRRRALSRIKVLLGPIRSRVNVAQMQGGCPAFFHLMLPSRRLYPRLMSEGRIGKDTCRGTEPSRLALPNTEQIPRRVLHRSDPVPVLPSIKESVRCRLASNLRPVLRHQRPRRSCDSLVRTKSVKVSAMPACSRTKPPQHANLSKPDSHRFQRQHHEKFSIRLRQPTDDLR